MTPNCHYVLDNDQPCGCPALRGQLYCRHHTPDAIRRRLAASPHDSAEAAGFPAGPIPRSAFTPYWRSQHRSIADSDDLEQLDGIFAMVVDALARHDISPRSAGRLLSAVLDRKLAIQAAVQQAAMLAVQQQYLSRRPAPRFSGPA